MQVTTFTPYALQMILRSRVRGFDVSGYTTKPGARFNGLFEYSRNVEPHGKILGYSDSGPSLFQVES
jgi:hypothetical protein